MKTSELAIVLGAALVLLMVVRKSTAAAPAITNRYDTKAINVPNANGWQYFTDGTAIGPDGKFYKNDTLIYDPMGMYSL